MAESPVNPFQIGGADVDGMGDDSRHMLLPGQLTALRMGRFPGSRSNFTIKGRTLYPRLVVTGWLRAESFAALYALIQQHADAVGTIGSQTVTIQGEDFNNCDWVRFEVLNREVIAYTDATATPGSPGVKVFVRFTFEIVADPS